METVKLVCGQQPVFYTFATPPNAPPVYTTTTATTYSAPMPKDGIYSTHQAMVDGTGAVTATVLIHGTNDPYTAGQNDIANLKFQNININTTNASATVTLMRPTEGYFRPDQTGNQVYATGVPNGTTFTYVSPTSGTLSANATATGTVPARFQANKWVLLGTITLTGTNEASDGFTTASSWKWTRASVTAVTGTGAAVRIVQGN
jgi:CHASE2 domain-containing sensor protein